MTKLKLEKAYSERGASMGRANNLPDDCNAPIKLCLEALQLVDGDYDTGGAYWGNSPGTNMYCAWRDDCRVFVRASNREQAKESVLEILPSASFTDKFSEGRFLQAYIEAALWTSIDDNEKPLDSNYGIDDLAPETLARMTADCEKFQKENALDLQELDETQSGHDFWLTRNGHGAGFWDRGYGELGECLTEASHKFGECGLYVGDDGKIHAA